MGLACCKNQAQSTEGAVKDNPDTKKEIISYKRQVYDALVAQCEAHYTKFKLYSDVRDGWVEIETYEQFCDATKDSDNFYTVMDDLKDYGYKIKNAKQFKEKWLSYDSLMCENRYKTKIIGRSIFMDLDKVIHKTLGCRFFGYERNKHAYREFSISIFRNDLNSYADGHQPIFYHNLNFSEIYYCNYCLSENNKKYITMGRCFY